MQNRRRFFRLIILSTVLIHILRRGDIAQGTRFAAKGGIVGISTVFVGMDVYIRVMSHTDVIAKFLKQSRARASAAEA